ncbi:MAG: c-type cytochrome [Deltaproteobacteria bacterium]|nr:c-type cytochrome [Deltaproteobacteria bacterium]
MLKRILLLITIFTLFPMLSLAEGDIEKGKEVYGKRCSWCHGKDGAGDGPASEFLNPAPRDFTLGVYKWKSTPFDEIAPSDEDFNRMIAGANAHNGIPGWTGMNGTSMPGWADMLSGSEIKNATAYIKSLGGLEKPEKGKIDLSSKVRSSKESIESGGKLFRDRCSECHGEEGRGDGTKKLKDDWGGRTWPRNLTKGWSFRVTNEPEDIYARITVGIPGTQMPSFADPQSKKIMTDKERWDVANYVASLDEPYKKPGDSDAIKAVRVTGQLPKDAKSEAWAKAEYTSFYMVPQIIANERHFKPSLNSISVKVLYNESEIVFLLEWDDPTKSMPWDEKAIEIADGELFVDGVAVQFPVVSKESEKPYFGMGDSKPVNIWFWQSEGAIDSPQSLKLMNSKGASNSEIRMSEEIGLKATGAYEKGTWRVILTRPLKTGDSKRDIQFEPGKFIPVAFAAWDGSNGDKGSRHVMTSWHWLILETEADNSFYVWPVLIGLFVFAGELLWLYSARRKKD